MRRPAHRRQIVPAPTDAAPVELPPEALAGEVLADARPAVIGATCPLLGPAEVLAMLSPA
jgi:hypothetical protein